MHQAGQMVDVFAVRRRRVRPDFPMQLSIPPFLSSLPYPWVSSVASRWIEGRFLASVREGDIAYLWPSASLVTHRILHERGIPIVLEGINTRMASAKRILDAAYDAFGAAPAHGITDERILEEEAKYRYANAIFAPSRGVELALKGSPLEHGILVSSYGADLSLAPHSRAPRTHSEGVVFLFCGFASVRKGTHHLLDAWAGLGGGHRLLLVGQIEPAIRERYRDLLSSDRVETVGFVKDVHAQFARADVFVIPSLEEGDPLVTYEAALHGLPILASGMGGGRMGDTPGAMEIIDPADTEAFANAMARLAGAPELRESLGKSVRKLVSSFAWSDVGAQRAEALKAHFPG
jgi:glycosyltransferase involved in cell wall biosynthesis